MDRHGLGRKQLSIMVAALFALGMLSGCRPTESRMGEETLRILVEQETRGDIREEVWVVVAKNRLDDLGITEEELAECVRTIFDEAGEVLVDAVLIWFGKEVTAPDPDASAAIKPSIRTLLSEGITLAFIELREGKVVKQEHHLLKLPPEGQEDSAKEPPSR